MNLKIGFFWVGNLNPTQPNFFQPLTQPNPTQSKTRPNPTQTQELLGWVRVGFGFGTQCRTREIQKTDCYQLWVGYTEHKISNRSHFTLNRKFYYRATHYWLPLTTRTTLRIDQNWSNYSKRKTWYAKEETASICDHFFSNSFSFCSNSAIRFLWRSMASKWCFMWRSWNSTSLSSWAFFYKTTTKLYSRKQIRRKPKLIFTSL